MSDDKKDINEEVKKVEDGILEKVEEKILSDKKAELKNTAKNMEDSDEEIDESSDLEESNNENGTGNDNTPSGSKKPNKAHPGSSKKPRKGNQTADGEIEDPNINQPSENTQDPNALKLGRNIDDKKKNRKNKSEDEPEDNETSTHENKDMDGTVEGQAPINAQNNIPSPEELDLDALPLEMEKSIRNGNKEAALEQIANHVLNGLTAVDAMRILNALKNQGLLDNNDIENFKNQEAPQKDMSSMSIPDLSKLLNESTDKAEKQAILRELANQGGSIKDLHPDDRKLPEEFDNENDEPEETPTEDLETPENTEPVQDIESPRTSSNIPSKKKEDPKEKGKEKTKSKEKNESSITDTLGEKAGKKIRPEVKSFFFRLFFVPPLCFYVWGGIMILLIITVVSSYISICVWEPDIGACTDALSLIPDAVVLTIKSILSGAIDLFMKLIGQSIELTSEDLSKIPEITEALDKAKDAGINFYGY